MNFVADENVDSVILERLRADGHAVISIAESSPGVLDPKVLALSAKSNAVLITADRDFGELVFRQGQANAGVLLLRLHGLSPQQKADVVAAAVKAHGDDFGGGFAVVSPGVVRIRHEVTR